MMFREMRRKKQLLSTEETVEILKRNTAGTLALMGADGYPYSLPISFVYYDNKIILHGAKEGHKIDAIRNCNKASFSVIDKDQIVPEEYTTYYQSVIAFGKIKILESKEEMKNCLDILAEKYRHGHEAEREKEMNAGLPAVSIMVLEIEHMTGKKARKLV